MAGKFVSVEADVKATLRDLTGMQREQIPFALSLGINNLANRANTEGLQPAIGRSFDRPTRYTLGGTFVARGNKRNPTATVGLIDKPRRGNRAPVKYLKAQLDGGQRRMTGYEMALRASGVLPDGWRVVPAQRVKLDRYGNIPRALLKEVLGALKSGFKVAAGKGKAAHMRGYFIAKPGDRRTAHLNPGVWLRVERGATKRKTAQENSGLQPVLMFVKNVDYRPRLNVVKSVERVVRQYARHELDSALQYALRSAR